MKIICCLILVFTLLNLKAQTLEDELHISAYRYPLADSINTYHSTSSFDLWNVGFWYNVYNQDTNLITLDLKEFGSGNFIGKIFSDTAFPGKYSIYFGVKRSIRTKLIKTGYYKVVIQIRSLKDDSVVYEKESKVFLIGSFNLSWYREKKF